MFELCDIEWMEIQETPSMHCLQHPNLSAEKRKWWWKQAEFWKLQLHFPKGNKKIKRKKLTHSWFIQKLTPFKITSSEGKKRVIAETLAYAKVIKINENIWYLFSR